MAEAATAVPAGITRLDTVENAWQVAVSTRGLAAGSMSSLKCLKKSTLIIGNDTAAKRKVLINFLLKCKEMDFPPPARNEFASRTEESWPCWCSF